MRQLARLAVQDHKVRSAALGEDVNVKLLFHHISSVGNSSLTAVKPTST